MKNLFNRINKEIEKEMMETGRMGTERVSVVITLNEEELQEWENLKLDEHYSWEIDGNSLSITYTEEIKEEKKMRKLEVIVKELAEIEMDSSTHTDLSEEYESITKYYLSNVESRNYEYFLTESGNVTKEEIEEYGVVDIINGVHDYIIENTEEKEE